MPQTPVPQEAGDSVDTPEPGGLSIEQARELVTGFTASRGCRGVDVTIYDPKLDPDGSAGECLLRLW